ncbi:MAG TPA: hypothetical protein VM912_19080 [Terriglobales bacterium]|nr:hypothetical protein [Terriglobales bacterium]
MPKSCLVGLLTIPLVCLTAVLAQNSSDQSPGGTKKPSSKNGQFEEKVLDLVVPTSLVIEGRETRVPPLSTAQKFGEVTKTFLNSFTFFGTAVETGVDQASDIHHGYGQGANGYAKRYGANIADAATAQFFGVGVYPSIFHADPRYYRMGNGGLFPRGWYAATRVFATRTDSGRRVFNAPEILASVTASGISRSYYPSDERTAGDFAYSMGSRIAFDAAYNLAKEFWPDVRKHVFKH